MQAAPVAPALASAVLRGQPPALERSSLNPDPASPQRALRGPFFICETAVKRRPRLTRARLRELLHYDPKTGQFRWRKRLRNGHRGPSAGCVHSQRGYRYIKIDRRVYSEHQLAWFYMTGRWCRPGIDHRDRDAANNRWSNLRRATASQNNANRRRPRHNASGYKGVYLSRRSGKWYAHIGRNGRIIHLGTFATAQAAHAAYCAAARKLFGEFARAE
jgi:hypothetical protein